WFRCEHTECGSHASGCSGRRARVSSLVTGGAGYIGSLTCVELLRAGHEVVVFDNFSNSHPEVLNRVEQITGRKPMLVRGDIRDQAALEIGRATCRDSVERDVSS